MNELELLQASLFHLVLFGPKCTFIYKTFQGRYFDAKQGQRISGKRREDEGGISQIGIQALWAPGQHTLEGRFLPCGENRGNCYL